MSTTIKSSKQVVCIKNTDAMAGQQDAQNFTINFSNSSFTNVQSAHEQSKCYFTPQMICMDWFYNNVSAAAGNNIFQVSGAGFNGGVAATYTIPDGLYDAVSLANAIASKTSNGANPPAFTYSGILNAAGNWTQGNTPPQFYLLFNVITNKYTITYDTANPAGASALTMTFVGAINGVNFDSRRIFGSITNSITIPVSRSFNFPTFVDLVPYQAVRIHSNVAKRTMLMQPNPAGAKFLSNSDVLFEIPTFNQQVGGILTFVPTTPDVYKQEIAANFDTMTIQVRDMQGNLVPLLPNAELNLTFVIEREITQPSNEDRVSSVADYSQFSRM
jgi:hypothetical protein